jgi:hypothetical protein
VYWVNHKTGKETAKGRIGMNEHWDQNAKLGHVSLHATMFFCGVISLLTFIFFIGTSYDLGLPVLLGSSGWDQDACTGNQGSSRQ